MPRTTDLAKQPRAFYELMDAVKIQGEVFVPTNQPSSLRGQLQQFFFAVQNQNHPRAAEAAAIMVRFAPKDDPRGKGILVCDRDRSPSALAIAQAIKGVVPSAEDAERALAKKLLF